MRQATSGQVEGSPPSSEADSSTPQAPSRWGAFKSTVRQVHLPAPRQWLQDYKWVLIVVVGAVLSVMTVDWLSLMGRDEVLSLLPESGGGTLETGFLIVYGLCGLITMGSILLLRGTSGGLSSLLGSSVEYGAMSTAGFERRVTRFMATVAVMFALMTLFSPLFLS